MCCCSGSFHLDWSLHEGSSNGGCTYVRACVRACVHARVSSCVPDAAPIDIGCVSSVEVTLLVYIHVMHMQIDFRWPEKLINVTIHMYPYLSKREKKREKEGYRSHLPRTIPMVESHVTFISHNSTWVKVTEKKGRGREREREREREKSRIGGLMWVGRKEREKDSFLGLGPPQKSGTKRSECRKRVWHFMHLKRAVQRNQTQTPFRTAPWSFELI